MAANPDIKSCPKYLPADNPARVERDATIALMSASGLSQPAIAAKTGLHVATVNRIINDDQAKEIIQRIHDKHILAAEDIQDNIINIAKTKPGANDDVSTKDIIAAAKQHNEIIGVASSHTQGNVFIGKYYQQNNTVFTNDGTRDLVKSWADRMVADIEIPEG